MRPLVRDDSREYTHAGYPCCRRAGPGLPAFTTGERRMVYRISITLVITLVVLAGLMPDPFNDVVQEMVRHLVRDAGWTYLVVVFVTLLFLLYLALGRFGRLRIGGEDAEPDFSYVSWLSMLFAAGMGIGLVFWGAAEPVSHFLQPPEGLQPESHAAARAAMRYSFRSEERRVGKECVRTCRSRCAWYH